jgi:hypothetical protein
MLLRKMSADLVESTILAVAYWGMQVLIAACGVLLVVRGGELPRWVPAHYRRNPPRLNRDYAWAGLSFGVSGIIMGAANPLNLAGRPHEPVLGALLLLALACYAVGLAALVHATVAVRQLREAAARDR